MLKFNKAKFIRFLKKKYYYLLTKTIGAVNQSKILEINFIQTNKQQIKTNSKSTILQSIQLFKLLILNILQ